MKSISSIFLILFGFSALAQQPSFDAAEIEKQIEKLGVLNRVLYFAAHPDDENTRLIAYLSKGKNVETAYFSLTRGDGGQNLIGDEKGDLLGVIRTQELLEARKIDGGTQYFSRAIDFGYSKSAEETFKHWEKDSLLADAVLVIRKFKPDVIVTRFPPDERAGHGHHTVSAIIAAEAFDAAADPNKFPESAKKYGVWQVQKLYWNESSWWNKDIANHKDEYTTVNIGAYDKLLGVSYSEISSKSRSQHQSQGFGMSIQRGDQIEYLKLLKGDSTQPDLFQDHFKNWAGVEGGKSIQKKWSKILSAYTPLDPQSSINGLIDLYFSLEALPENPYKSSKKASLKNIIAACGGLWLDFRAEEPNLVSNQNFGFTALAISQSEFPFVLSSVRVNEKTYPVNEKLSNVYTEISDTIPAPKATSTPYWLAEKNDGNWFIVKNRSFISQPKNAPVLTANFIFETAAGTIEFERPLLYKWTDRVRGELYRNVNIVELISIAFDKKVTLAKNNSVLVRITGNAAIASGKVQLIWDNGNIASEIYTFSDLQKDQTIPLEIILVNANSGNGLLHAKVWENNSETFTHSLIEIAYPHIHTQVILPEAEVKILTEKIKVTRKNIGYIMGSGDEIPEALSQLGCAVTHVNPATATLETLRSFDGVIVGIRAYNTLESMNSLAPILNQYVFNGGFVMVQYNTNRGMVTKDIGPYPIQLSRIRVTEEDAQVVRLQRGHPLLQTPNVIEDADFENWVQERGLYFADEWDAHYTPILGWNDTGEDLSKGGLLATDYGKGHYVFTGISFFRQLPAGVNGAYKLFANIISYGAVKGSESK